MSKISRREAIQAGIGLAAGAAAGAGTLLHWAEAWAADQPWKPEPGAKIRMLRWNRFVESEDIQFDKNIAAFTTATGIPVRLDKEFIDDIQPKASVAANVGAGPDIVWGPMVIPHLIPDKLLAVNDVADYLGGKYGGWYDMPRRYATRGSKWMAIPLCTGGNYINYRKSWMNEAGFKTFPDTTDGLLTLSKALKKNGHPGGMALGHATGDANAWTYWLLFAFGGRITDEQGKVAINSPETVAALEYIRELYPHWIAGTASWNDSNNNKAFLSGQVSYTNNGISIYAAAVRKGMTAIAEDMDHAFYPIGPVGRASELQLPFPIEIFGYTKYPNACKALLAFGYFVMEKQQYDAWLEQSVGYFTQTLKSYESAPVWTEDPKRRVFRDASVRSLDIGYAGPLGYAAAQVLADFVVVDMVAEAATGQASPKDAARRAEKRVNRYYRI